MDINGNLTGRERSWMFAGPIKSYLVIMTTKGLKCRITSVTLI